MIKTDSDKEIKKIPWRRRTDKIQLIALLFMTYIITLQQYI